MPLKPKRHFTQQRMERVGPASAKRGRIRPHVFDYINNWDGDMQRTTALYATLRAEERRALVSRLSSPYHLEAVRCIYQAACLTMPERHNATAQVYSPRQLLAVIALRWWLGVGVRALLTYLRENEPQRYVIFGRHKSFPHIVHLRDFEVGLRENWRRFLDCLALINIGTAKTIITHQKAGIL